MDACRACLQITSSDRRHALFEIAKPAATASPTSHIYHLLTSIQIERNDGLSWFLCQQCDHKLIEFQHFREMCLRSDEQIRNSLQPKQSAKIASDEITIKLEADAGSELSGSSTDDEDDDSRHPSEDNNSSADVPKQRSNGRWSPKPERHKSSAVAGRHKNVETGTKFECDLCAKHFYKKRSLIAHLRSHVGLKPFCCAQCPVSFSKFCSLQRHQQRKHPTDAQAAREPIKYACEVADCSKSYVTKDALRIHVQRVHLGEQPEARLVCETCGAAFPNNCALTEHSYRHMDASQWPHACHMCPKRFIQKGTLQTHLKRHLNIKEFACALCETRTCTKGELETHMLSHNKEMTEECRQCGKMFSSKRNMIRHARAVHEGRKPYVCSNCGLAFGMKRIFVEHMMRHTGEKPHGCEICGRRFIKPYALKTHLKVHAKQAAVATATTAAAAAAEVAVLPA